MVVWDNERQQIAPFGMNKQVAMRNEEEEGGNPEHEHMQIMYKVFDILYIKAHGDESEEINLMGARLKDRKAVLEKVVKEVPNTLEIVRGKECMTVDEVFEEFN